MARSTIKFLKQPGQFNTRIASLAGCDRHTVARVLADPTDPPRRRRRVSTLEERRAAVRSWIAEAIPTARMLELARQDPAAPYTGGASTFYRFVAKLRAEGDAWADALTPPMPVCFHLDHVSSCISEARSRRTLGI